MILFSLLAAAIIVPKCQVSGILEETQLMPAYELGCIKTKNCPSGIPTSAPERYLLKLKVGSISGEKCTPYYSKDKIITVFVNKDEKSFTKGQNVDGFIVDTGKGILNFEENKAGIEKALQLQNKESFWSKFINAIKKLFEQK